jgi:hypothetical protein
MSHKKVGRETMWDRAEATLARDNYGGRTSRSRAQWKSAEEHHILTYNSIWAKQAVILPTRHSCFDRIAHIVATVSLCC